MRLVTFHTRADAANRLGVMADDDRVIDVQARHREWFGAASEHLASMLALIESGPHGLDRVRSLARGDGAVLHLGSEARLVAPIPLPPQIRDGLGFLGHLVNAIDGRNRRANIPGRSPQQSARIELFLKKPSWYKANRFSVIGPDRTVTWPVYSDFPDYEHELACVLWKGGRDIPVDRVDDHIFGYMNFNDLSARDVQPDEMAQSGPTKCKDFDDGNVFGPWIVTADAFDPANARMRSWINGTLANEGRMADMHYSFADVISYISLGETLHPGEIIGSGTVPGGCRLESGQQLEFGDVVEIETDGLGRLKVTIAPR